MTPLKYRGMSCSICGGEFPGLEEYKGHTDDAGEPCPGGTPNA